MIIRKAGLVFERLTRERLEEARLGRNSPQVREQLLHADEITLEQQIRWFESLDPRCSFYFMVLKGGESIGMANLTDMQLDATAGPTRTSFAIYFWDQRYRNSVEPFRAQFVVASFAYHLLRVAHGIITVKKTNLASHRFSLTFGMEPKEEDPALGVIHYDQPCERFLQLTPILNRKFRLGGDPLPLSWDDVTLEESEQWLRALG